MSTVKKTYDFKSVGQLKETVDQMNKNTDITLPIGITTPMSFNSTGNTMFKMSTDIGTQIKDNLRNLLSTNKGERLMLTNFGANLKELAYDLSTEAIDSMAIDRISSTVSVYMPFVELETFEPRVEKSPSGEVILSIIKIGYGVPGAGLTNQVLEVGLVVTS